MLQTSPAAFDAVEALPMPCLKCGAPMTIGQGVGLHAAPALSCGFCGSSEALPPDAAQRHQHLRLRITQLTRARATFEAPLTTYRSIKAAFVPGLMLLIGASALQLYSGARQLSSGAAPTLMTLFPLTLIVGMSVGLLGMMLTFRKLVQPLLLAKPPQHSGMPARCRSCGGDLPLVRTTSVTCTYCSADNLLSATLTQDVSELLHHESQAYFAHARGEKGDPNAYSRPARAFYVWGGAAALGTLGALQGVLTWLQLAE